MTEPSPSTPGPRSLADTPPRLLVALALVAAVALTQVAAVLAMLVAGGDAALSGELGLLARIHFGARLVDFGVLLLVPLALLLARPIEADVDARVHPAVRSVLLGASSVGAAAAFLLALRVLADLGGGDFLPAGVASALLVDLAHLLVAFTGAWWAYRELQRTPPSPKPAPVSPAPPEGGGGASSLPPVTWPPAPAFPTGPPPPAETEGIQPRR